MSSDSQLPSDLRQTMFEQRIHPRADITSKNVDQFFFEYWPFINDEQKERFVEGCYTLIACANCPMSRNARLDFGCRLLTITFLVDDILEPMSFEERAFHQNMMAESARGTFQPDAKAPAQMVMHMLFQAMRVVDEELAGKLLEPTIDFLLAQAHTPLKAPTDLKEYLEYRSTKIGKGLLSRLMQFCAALHLTSDELDAVKVVEENWMKHIIFVNDICSFDEEMRRFKNVGNLSSICSSVTIMMRFCGVNEIEAKRIMWQMVRGWEVQHFDLVEQITRDNPSAALSSYLKLLEYSAAHNEMCALDPPRHQKTKGVALTEVYSEHG